jgi:hypothetical protein
MIKRRVSFLLASAVVGIILTVSSMASAYSVDYTSVADGNYTSVVLGGTTVTGSSLVTSRYFAGFRGLGIQGGGGDVSLDIGETMTIDFGQLVSNVQLTLVDIDPPGNVTFFFEAFNGLTSLGIFYFPAASTAPETYNLSTLDGGQAMSSFIISVEAPAAPLGLQIQGVSYEPVPIPAAIWLLGPGLVGLLGLRRRMSK